MPRMRFSVKRAVNMSANV